MMKKKEGKSSLLGWGVSVFFVALIILTVVLTTSLYAPTHLFLQPDSLKVGFLLNPDEDALWTSAEEAIKDIQKSIRNLDPLVPKPPSIKGKRAVYRNSTDLLVKFDELFHLEGLRIFYGFDNTNLATILEHAEKKQIEDSTCCTFISSKATYYPPDKSELSKVILTNFDDSIMADAYLKLINETNPTQKLIHIVPVVRTDGSSRTFFDHLVKISRNYPNLKFTSPVLFEKSEYPKTDAFQIVSDIGSRIALVPRAEVFLTSSEELPFIIESSKVNNELRKRRWFARNLDGVEPEIRKSENYSLFCSEVSLTTLTFLADEGSQWHVDLAFEAAQHLDPSRTRLSYHRQISVYRDIMLMHRAFTKSHVKGRSGGIYDSLAEEGPFKDGKRFSGILVSNMFNANEMEIRSVPNTGWIMDKWITIDTSTDSNDLLISEIRSHPLYKSEVKRLANLTSRKCFLGTIHVELSPTVFTPISTEVYNEVESMPDILLLPVQKGVRVTFECTNSELDDIGYICLPIKFNEGNLTCMTAILGESSDVRRIKRETRLSSKIMDTAKDIFGDTLTVWQKLVPNILSCSQTFIGCDYCMYFLSTYNVSASPAACMAGCALGMVGSCSSMVGKSLEETYKIID